ncbi:MAG: fatty acid desaturase [Bacteroidota bacterium]
MQLEEIKKSLANWPEIVAKYQKPNSKKALSQILGAFLPFVALWVAMYFSLRVSYFLTLFLGIVNAFFLLKIFTIQHDCGHQSFFKSRKLNNLVGFICSMFSFVPYKYWAREHNFHHAHNGQLDRESRKIGDISVMTVKEFESHSPIRRLRYRLFRNPIILFFIGPVYYMIVNNRFNIRRLWNWKTTRRSLLINNATVLSVYLSLGFFLGWKKFFMVQIPIFYVFAVTSVWFFYVQHNHKNNYKAFKGNWDYLLSAVKGSSYYKLPKVFQWLSGNIGFHHIHHLSSLIPNYNLERCHNENPAFGKYVTVMTFTESLKTVFNKLWDEENQKMISFGEFYRRQKQLAA